MAETSALDATLPDPYALPLDAIDVSDGRLSSRMPGGLGFARLRAEAPVHYCAESAFGPYWSITRFDDIKAVDMDHHTFSSEPSIIIGDPPAEFRTKSFIGTDGARHDAERKAVQPAVAPAPARQSRSADPLARCRNSRFTPGGRALRLGTGGIHRTHHPDARNALRLPLRGPPQASILVGRCDFRCGSGLRAPGGSRASAHPHGDARLLHRPVAGARTANPGNDFISMMVKSPAYAGMSPMEFIGQSAHRRRQRHDAKLHYRRRLRP